MSNGYYAMMLQLHGRHCVIIGGGAIAERKVRGLLEAGADRITVISPKASAYIMQLAEKQIIELKTREYREEDARGADLLFAVTDIRAVNEQAAADGRASGALVQMTDDGANGDFITPAIVRRGELLLSVSTSGSSPALASIIRKELESAYSTDYERWTERLGRLRAYAYETMGESGQDRAGIHAALRLAAEDVHLHLAAKGRHDAAVDSCLEHIDLGEWLSGLLHRIDRRTCR